MARWKKILLASAIVLLGAVALYKLWPSFFIVDLEQVNVSPARTVENQATLFDRALINNINEFKDNKAFSHVFSAGVQYSDIANLWVDRCEVSQANFQSFTQWRKLVPQASNEAVPGQPHDWIYRSDTRGHAISGKLSAAASGVTFYDAYAYCKSVGGRLPFRDEWVAIASGGEARLYPWGNESTSRAWPYLDRLLNASQRCGAHPQTSTRDGVHDLGSNVSEWGQSRGEKIKPVILGGNAYDRPYEVYSLNILYRRAPIRYRSPYVGFRCLYDKRPEPRTPWYKNLDVAEFKGGKYSVGLFAGSRVANLILNLPKEQFGAVAAITGVENSDRGKDRVVSFMTHEVVRGAYRSFLLDPFARIGMYADDNEPRDHSYTPNDWARQMERPELPVVSIDWWSANAYATWSGGRLPTSEEWAIAASNNGKTLYPWGNEFQSKFALTGDVGLGLPSTPRSWPGDKTRNGIYDMGGNVSEWTGSSWLGAAEPTVIARGGNFLLPGGMTAGIQFVNELPPGYRSPALGLRVVFDGGAYFKF